MNICQKLRTRQDIQKESRLKQWRGCEHLLHAETEACPRKIFILMGRTKHSALLDFCLHEKGCCRMSNDEELI